MRNTDSGNKYRAIEEKMPKVNPSPVHTQDSTVPHMLLNNITHIHSLRNNV